MQCTAYRQPGLGGLPMLLRLSEGFGVSELMLAHEIHSFQSGVRREVDQANLAGSEQAQLLEPLGQVRQGQTMT